MAESLENPSPDHADFVSDAFALLTTSTCGILSTVSGSTSGYPFGSVVPYCLDYDGIPIVLISSIAEHTRNIKQDSRASLIALDGLDGDVQARSRVTLIGDFQQLSAESVEGAERYYRYFPESRDYHKTHNFSFYKIHSIRIRYIGGFGAIHWIAPEKFHAPNVFSVDEELSMINHMNEDHIDAMARYCELADLTVAKNGLTMAGVDQTGFHIKAGQHLHRFQFENYADTTMKVRQELVKMAKR